MKHILILCCILSLGACYKEYDTNWAPTPIQEDVGCCITEQQVHGAIYKALLKRKWNIIDSTTNSFSTIIKCKGQNINVKFANTNKAYTIIIEDKITDIYNYRYCIESRTNQINKYIKVYLKKAISKSADKELIG